MNSLSTTTTRHFKRFYSLQLRSNKFSSQAFKKQQNSLKFLNTNLNNVSLTTSALASRSSAASFLSTRHFSSKKQTVVKTGGDVNDKPASKKAVDALMMKAVMLANEDKMEESRAVLQDAVEQYRKMKSTDGIIRSLNTLALLHAKERNYLECCAALTECVELARTLPDGKEMLQKLLQQLGTSYAEAERDDSARETLKEALELAKELKIAGAQGLANLSLGALASPLRGRKGAIYQTAVRHLNAAIKNFEMADDVDHQLKCTVLLAREHHGAQNLDLSNQVWDQVLQICEPMPSRVEEWEAYYGLAENYANMGDEHLKLCLDSYKEALSTAEQLKNSQLQMMTLQSLGLAYFASKQHSEALETAEKFHELARTAGDNINAVVQSLIQMARFTEPIDIKQALQQYEAAVSAAVSKAPGSEAEAMAVARLADARRRNDEGAIAMQLFEKCVRICKKLGDPPLTIEVLTNLGQLHQKSQSYKEAISCLKRAEEISEGVLGADLHRLNLLMLMGQIYRSMNKPIQANDALAKGMTLAGALHRQGVIKDLPQEFKDALEQGQKESAEEQK